MSWRTKDDVLKDLGAVNGRRTGAEHLDQHVVEGDLPPPIVHETIDKDELKYFTRGYSRDGQHKEPDLPGISAMLKIVNGEDHEPNILYRNRATDEIRISKLNPLAGEYVPPGFNSNRPQARQQHERGSPNKKPNAKVKPYVPEPVNGDVPGFNDGSTHSTVTTIAPKPVPPFGSSMFKPRPKKIEQNALENKQTIMKSPADSNETAAIPDKAPPPVPNVLPNKTDIPCLDKMETKTADIKEIQQKIKSTILASSNDNSLKAKKQKNVAIAALLKLGSMPQAVEQPVKLIKPEYFESPPTKKDLDIQNGSVDDEIDKVEELVVPATSNSEMDLNYKDPDSISKVTGWFDAMESPKRVPYVPPPKPVLKESVTFKKKETSSPSSKTSEVSKEKLEPVKERNVPKAISFKPSSYASDLLKKYESNAQKVAPSAEDLGEMLERQLKERDEVIRQKMLAKQNAG